MFCCCQNELSRLEAENETMAMDIEKMEKYVTGLASHNATKEANLKDLSEALQLQRELFISHLYQLLPTKIF